MEGTGPAGEGSHDCSLIKVGKSKPQRRLVDEQYPQSNTHLFFLSNLL
jgi:hypothetical protein